MDRYFCCTECNWWDMNYIQKLNWAEQTLRGIKMKGFTDANVPVNCAECLDYFEGKHDLLEHVLTVHKNYTASEAQAYVSNWIEAAHIQQEEQLAGYYDDRKIERAIDQACDSDLEHSRHGL